MIEALLAGLFGLLIGSFLNVCIYRLPRDLSVVTPRSHCPFCEHTIAWYDNVPLLSYAMLRGKCRHCQARIPIRYPIVELLTGACFFVCVLELGLTLSAAKYCTFSAILIALVFSDLEERILPDEFTKGGTVLGLGFAALVPVPGIWSLFWHPSRPWLVSLADSTFAAFFSAGGLWLVAFLYEKIRHREGMGLGDVKMVAMIGAFLGLQGVMLAIMAGSALGAVLGLAYIAIARKEAATYELPFGSFLGIAALLVGFYGEFVAHWWRA